MDQEPSEILDDDAESFAPVTDESDANEVPDEELNMIEETTPLDPDLEGEAGLV